MLLVFIVNALIVTFIVLLHYAFLFRLSLLLPKLKIKPQFRILLGVFGALFAHITEIWVFALAYYVMVTYLGWGSLSGNFNGELFDCAYYSFTSYTTLGFGDIHPLGYVRYLTGIESLIGLLMITWSASFLYLEMERYWRKK